MSKPTSSFIGETDESHLRLIAKKRWLMPRGRAACIAGADAIAALDSLRVNLRLIEWAGDVQGGDPMCPACLGMRAVHGHADECWLGSIVGAL